MKQDFKKVKIKFVCSGGNGSWAMELERSYGEGGRAHPARI